MNINISRYARINFKLIIHKYPREARINDN